ncbi:MAG: hypothetical protein R3B09_22830 [Nannocystaceae bacterium]
MVSRLRLLALVAGATTGAACHSQEEARVEDACETFTFLALSCQGLSTPDCEPCNPACVERWRDAEKIDAACGTLYLDYWECVAGLACGELDAWSQGVSMGSSDGPCGEREIEFRARCGSLRLLGSDP